jgi:hypothetical protein
MAKQKKILKQMKIFDAVTKEGLAPNSYYVLCSIRESVLPSEINIHRELKSLVEHEWIKENDESAIGAPYSLTPKAVTLIDKLEKLFILKKSLTSSQLMGEDAKANITKYNEMFPNVKLPTGKAARAAYGNLEKNFRWFFENHKYEWDVIFKATAQYVNEYQQNNYKFMRTSQYFIRKNHLSDLADRCENLNTGGDQVIATRHATKVV